MKRQWIPIDKLHIFDEFHYEVEGGFEVNVELDGNTTDYHVEGIKRVMNALEAGCKILPILVVKKGEEFYLLDGFKRSYAQRELGYKHLEAFVCNEVEVHEFKCIPFQNHHLRCYKGGQPYEHFTLFEGAENDEQGYDTTEFLYKSPHDDGLRIEVSECVHVHWGAYGRYRLSLGRRDFVALAKAVSSIKV